MQAFFQKTPSLVLAILAAVLIWLSWPPFVTPFFSFIAFGLLLIAEEKLSKKKKHHYFWHVYLAMLIWNIATTYWVYNATPIGSVAWVLNALFMTLPWLAYRKVKQHYPIHIALICFIGAWLSFEYLHFNWEVAWPWLALGNVFAKTPNLVQWYEYTGTGGGTLLILVLNCLFFLAYRNAQKWKIYAGLAISLIVFPLLISYSILSRIEETGKEINFVVIQPNFNPYTRDYSNAESMKQIEVMNQLGKENVELNTDFVVFSESSFPFNPWVSEIDQLESLLKLEQMLEKTEHGSVIIGADAIRLFKPNEEKTATARYSKGSDVYYDVYNAGLHLKKGENNNELYIKSKLVPGVERMPYPKQLKFFQKFAIALGGISGSRATQPERTVFENNGIKVGTAICYESVFGDFMNDFAKKGAEILVIITNDGWWKNTSGYRQHLQYARLRAIESRRSIARCANTGVSAFINSKGEVLQITDWWKQAVLKGQLKTNKRMTFYTLYGDYIYRIGVLIFSIILLITFVKSKTKGFQYRV